MLNNKNTISCNFTSQNVLFIINIYTSIVLLLTRVIFISTRDTETKSVHLLHF